MKGSASDERPRPPAGGGSQDFPFRIQKPEPDLPPDEVPDDRPAHRRAPIRDPWRHILFVNLRTFLIVGAGMSVFFALAMFTSIRAWRLKEARATSTKPATAQDSEARGRRRIKDPTRLENAEWGRRAGSAGQSDTDAIHAALLLAKRADALVESGETREAIDLYTEALTVWPHLTAARIKLGRLFLTMRDYIRAQEYLEAAVDNDPGSPDLINDLGVSYFHQRRITTAMKQFKSAVQIDDRFAPAYFNLALCHLSMADQNSARDYLHKYLLLVPDDTRALKQKAFLDATDGDYTNAMTTLQQAISIDSNWPSLRFDAAATAALMGRGGDAIVHLQKAETLASPSAVYLVYQQPAFREVRLSEQGRAYLKDLVERARERAGVKETYNPLRDVIEPVLSNPPTEETADPDPARAQEK
jgi:tetratricopeptide (TPR) repeat protein